MGKRIFGLEDLKVTQEAARDLCDSYTRYLAHREFLPLASRNREYRKFKAAFLAVRTQIEVLREETDELLGGGSDGTTVH